MPEVGAANPEDHVGGDVGGVVGDALQIARDDDGLEGLRGAVGALLDDADKVGVREA